VHPSYNLPDTELLLLLKSKDEKALSYVYDLYAPGMYGLILKKVKDEDLAAKILKCTFLNIWKECGKADCFKQRLFTWILSQTHKTALTDFKIDLNTSKEAE
jgi:RNA polymerase sigma-70 factor (ECF subfamily)